MPTSINKSLILLNAFRYRGAQPTQRPEIVRNHIPSTVLLIGKLNTFPVSASVDTEVLLQHMLSHRPKRYAEFSWEQER